MMTIFINTIWCVKVDLFVGNWSKRRQTETSTTKTSTNRNTDIPKCRQTKTKAATNQNVDIPKHQQTKASSRRQTETYTSKSLARSLSPSHSLTSPQFNATSTQRNSTNHSIRLFTYSLTYWFRSSLINTYILSFTLIISHIRFLTWLFTHFITHPLTYSSTHSLAQKFTRSLNYSHIHVITQSFTHSPTRSSIHALSISSYIHPITNL